VARVRFAVLYILAWVPLAALYALVLGSRPEMNVFSTVMATLWTIGSAALLGSVVWWLSRRIQFVRSHLPRFLIVHALLAITYGTLLTGEIAGSIYYRASKAQYEAFMREAFGWQVLYGIALILTSIPRFCCHWFRIASADCSMIGSSA